MNNSENNKHTMAWVGFGLSIASFVLIFLFNIPILFIVLGIICITLSIADISRAGKSVPAIIALVLTIILLILSGLEWYINVRIMNEMQNTIHEEPKIIILTD